MKLFGVSFFTNDHSANDITLIPLELIKSNRDRGRKATEAYFTEVRLSNTWKLIRMMKSSRFLPFVFIYIIFTLQISFI